MSKTTAKQTMKLTMTMITTANNKPRDSIARDDSSRLFSDDGSILSLPDNDSVPVLCTRFKIKPEIDVVVESYSTVQIQVADDFMTSIILKEMIKRIDDLRLFEGDGCQPMLVLD